MWKRSHVVPGIQATPAQSTPRFFALNDGDPDGLAIMSTYKYGSMAHAHESARLNVPRLEWLGLRISDIVSEKNKLVTDDWVTISLTRRDSKKIQKMLSNNPVFAEDGPQPDWRAELQTMMLLNIKVETEVLYGADGGLEAWMDSRIMSMWASCKHGGLSYIHKYTKKYLYIIYTGFHHSCDINIYKNNEGEQHAYRTNTQLHFNQES